MLSAPYAKPIQFRMGRKKEEGRPWRNFKVIREIISEIGMREVPKRTQAYGPKI